MLGMMTVRVAPDNGEPYTVTATSRDMYQWEKTGRGRSAQQIREGSFEAMYQLAHVAAKRQQLFTGTLEEFVASCDLDFTQDSSDSEEDRSDPTSGGVSGSS